MGRGAEDGALLGLVPDGLRDAGTGVSHDEGPVGHAEVHVVVAVYVGDPASLTAVNDEREGLERSDRGGDAPGGDPPELTSLGF